MNTAQDIVAYLLAATGGGAQDGEHAAIRQAVINGVREVMQARNWLWHTRSGSFVTTRVATVGTISQGSKNITVASPDGFVPGRVVSVSASYFPNPMKIVSVNGNVVSLNVEAKQSGTNVPIQAATYYDLPADLKDIDTLVTNTVGTLHCYLTPQEWQRLEINTRGAGEPYYYTIMRSDEKPDRWQIRFVGVPVDDTVVHYTYRASPQPVKYMGYERICRQGTVAVAINADGVPVVTGTGTAFPQDCTGAYIRFGAAGMEAEANGATFPYVMQRRVAKWDSPTSLLITTTTDAGRTEAFGGLPDSALDGGVVGGPSTPPVPPTATVPYSSPLATLPANTKYAITDYIDAAPHMWTAILSGCEMWYARVSGKPAGDVMAIFNRDLRIAMENDQIAPLSGRPNSTPYPTSRSMGWHSELMPDVS